MTSLVAAVSWTVLQTDIDPLPSAPEVGEPLLRGTGFVVGFAVVALVGFLVAEPAISRIINRRNRNNPTLAEAISRYVRLFVLICALFVGLSAAGFTGVVGNSALVIAAGTLALGVAGQSVIGSLVSGMALVADPQFNIGDYIRWEGGEGRITSITLRVTRVRTLDGGLMTIPNTTLTNEVLVRPFEQGRSRTSERVAIAYEDDLDTAFQLLTEIADDVEGVLDTPAPMVVVEELGSDAVVLRVHYWVDNPRQNLDRTRSAFARAVKERLRAAGVEISPASKRNLEGRIQVDETV